MKQQNEQTKADGNNNQQIIQEFIHGKRHAD
jgi:hypothetical protein